VSDDQVHPPTARTGPSVTPVAIVVRTKNRPILLRRALDNVFAQTFTDFVVVVVNDVGDAAEVDKVVAEFADRADGRVQTIHRESSTGMESASNAGILATSSTYLSIHDDDDTWAPTFLDQTVRYLEDSDDPGVAVRTEVIYEHIDGDEITVDSREILAGDLSQMSLSEMLVHNYAPPISLLYRRDVLDVIGLYDETLPVLADWDFNLRYLSRFTMGFLDGPPLAFWHQRPTSVGDEGNSVVTGQHDHERIEIEIRDRYLRSDLERNSHLGTLLYLAETLRSGNADRSTHLSGRVEHLETVIRQSSVDRATQVSGAVAHLEAVVHTAGVSQFTHELADLNRNLVSQNNRMIAQFDALAARVDQIEELIFSQTPRARMLSYRRAARHQLARLTDRARRRS
jgi:glycosyltransferase involved in cell wall biosynthesis